MPPLSLLKYIRLRYVVQGDVFFYATTCLVYKSSSLYSLIIQSFQKQRPMRCFAHPAPGSDGPLLSSGATRSQSRQADSAITQ